MTTVLYDPDGRIEAELPLDRTTHQCLVKAVLAWKGDPSLQAADYQQIALLFTGAARSVAHDVRRPPAACPRAAPPARSPSTSWTTPTVVSPPRSRAPPAAPKNADGDAYFPRVQDTGDSRYRLAPAVTCDWRNFQSLARIGLARHDGDGELALRRALALVRPFAAIDPQRYAWAEPVVQEIVSAIADVAYELSTRRR
ncbi:hypothetical protein [Streptomyces lateritius]|uniref:hypothetical protein n=1 Tax=Streptomyces lateritius TaxID=67313 RepID=UPI0019933AF0|nr:hypothetical protein [Streptomyces lateritius]GGT84464.1 hypothetical protein GCM10010272_31350 [Streptomyces lateritius]